MRELEPAAVADVIERVCATETFADVTPVWDKKPDTEVSGLYNRVTGQNGTNLLLTKF